MTWLEQGFAVLYIAGWTIGSCLMHPVVLVLVCLSLFIHALNRL